MHHCSGASTIFNIVAVRICREKKCGGSIYALNVCIETKCRSFLQILQQHSDKKVPHCGKTEIASNEDGDR